MLSIIIPTLNEEKYLPGLLEEIKKQNLSDYEIIVADAGSKDKTVEIAKEYGCQIVPGGLPSKGRNEGAKVAKGNLILFLDADIISLPPSFFEDILEEFEKRKLTIASCCLSTDGKIIDKIAYGSYNLWAKLTEKIWPKAVNVALVSKEAHQKVNGFDETIKLAEDFDYAQRISKIGQFGLLRIPAVKISSRRFATDGRFRTFFKFILAGFYIVLVGPIRTDIFKYRFNHYGEKGEKDRELRIGDKIKEYLVKIYEENNLF